MEQVRQASFFRVKTMKRKYTIEPDLAFHRPRSSNLPKQIITNQEVLKELHSSKVPSASYHMILYEQQDGIEAMNPVTAYLGRQDYMHKVLKKIHLECRHAFISLSKMNFVDDQGKSRLLAEHRFCHPGSSQCGHKHHHEYMILGKKN